MNRLRAAVVLLLAACAYGSGSAAGRKPFHLRRIDAARPRHRAILAKSGCQVEHRAFGLAKANGQRAADASNPAKYNHGMPTKAIADATPK